jgi:hypothetical protein
VIRNSVIVLALAQKPEQGILNCSDSSYIEKIYIQYLTHSFVLLASSAQRMTMQEEVIMVTISFY